MLSDSIKKPKEFLKEFLDEYLSDGMGAKSKREIDILLMHLLMKYADLAARSNQELSILLQMPISRVKSLRYEARLKYPPEADYVEREFLILLSRSQFDFDREKIVFVIEDEYLRQAIQGRLKARGRFADSSFNTEIVRIDRTALEEAIEELYGKDIAANFRDGFEEMGNQADGVDVDKDFRESITKFAVETLKTLGLEFARNRIGIS